MSKKNAFQFLAIGFLIIGVLLTFPNTNWHDKNSIISFIVLILGTVSSIVSIYIPTSYSSYFHSEESNRFVTKISAKDHGQGSSPNVEVFLLKIRNIFNFFLPR